MAETERQIDVSPVRAPVAQYCAPRLEDLAPAVLAGWTKGFKDPELSSSILADRRLAPRILRQICAERGQTVEVEAPGEADTHFISVLGRLGVRQFSALIGCVLYRATVLEWITWNALDTHLPDVPMPLIRTALTSTPNEVSSALGYGDAVDTALTCDTLLETGELALWTCFAELPDDVQQRLSLFHEPWSMEQDTEVGDVVRLIASGLFAAEAEA